ncbi:MAG: pseudouridine synthase [Rhizobiaceae bacterium]|nr:pseudouridine synthase [Rhizobiaceae bacterium]
MTDDDTKRPAGKAPRKPDRNGRGADRPRAAKPGFGKPGFGKDGKAQGAAKKPFVKRERPSEGGGERSRPGGFEKRAEGDRPFRKPFVKRERDGEADRGAPRRFSRPDGGEAAPRKPFVKRDRAAQGEAADGGPRRFGPRVEGERGPRKHFVRRERPDAAGADAPRAPRRFERREDGDKAPRKPFVRSGDRERRPEGDERPRRFDRRDGFDKPRFSGDGRERPERPERPERAGRRERAAEHGSGQVAEGARAERAPRRFDRPEGRERPQRRDGAGFDKPVRKSFPRGDETAPVEGERIAKRLARVGIASRRDAEELVAAGRIKVNGRVLDTPAFNVTAEDVIELDGNVLPPIERTRLFLFHKPAGVVTTNRDPDGRRTVFDVLPRDLPRVVTVGRLDINTEGLLLLTNDGGLARTLELPATGWLRRYRVRVHGKVDEKRLAELKDGIAVDGVFYGSIEASLDREQGSNAWLTIGLREGKNREVKNILGALGLEVGRLIRVSFGPFQLGELLEGHVQEIKGKMLRDQLGERLVEESGANFEADIVKPFSNRPVRRTETSAQVDDRPKVVRDGIRGREGEGGLIKARKRRENSRDEALGKLSTKPDRGGFGGKDRSERGPKRTGDRPPIEPPGQRKTNVWMAPGARPIGKGRAEADAAKAAERKASPRKPAGPHGGNPDGRGPRPGKRPKRED